MSVSESLACRSEQQEQGRFRMEEWLVVDTPGALAGLGSSAAGKKNEGWFCCEGVIVKLSARVNQLTNWSQS